MEQINPQHTIPTLVDRSDGGDGFAVWESRTIQKYLVDKVSPGHWLYPTDLKTRTNINRWLDFDLGSLYPAIAPVLYPVFLFGQPLDQSKVPTLKEKLKVVDDALQGKTFLVTETYTLADITILVNISTLEVLRDLDISEFSNIVKWKENLRNSLPYYQEVNQSGLDFIHEWIKSGSKIA